ncbi:MAG: hypothetical protein ACR2GZ_03160 [Solirubrobacteraceae bacterium]
MATRPPITIEALERWEESGALWRTAALTPDRVVVELCTCSGEPVDALASEDPELIALVRRRGSNL